jgi:tetratricopeptide (TPR) repeat protein
LSENDGIAFYVRFVSIGDPSRENDEAMSRPQSDRVARRLAQAEGYLLLDLPQRALEILSSQGDWGEMQFEASFLCGEGLRALGRFRDAMKPLEHAHDLRPGHVGVAISLGWCYKRTHRLAQAIEVLEQASRAHPEEALLHYNLSCYWSLAGNPPRALQELGEALGLDSSFRGRIKDEPDFDAIRSDPAFDRLLQDQTAQA